MDIGNLIYIVIVVVYVLYTFVDNMISKNKEPDDGSIVLPDGEVIYRQDGPSIEDRLDDYLNPDRTITPSTNQEEDEYLVDYEEEETNPWQEPRPSTTVVERPRPSKSILPPKQKKPKATPKTNTTTDSISDAIERNKDEEMSRVYDISKMEEEEEDGGFTFNVRDMIIYETIMRRKY